MKKKLSFWMIGFCSMVFIQSYSQVGIGTTSVESNLLLKVNSSDKGVLIPNLTIPNANSPIPVTNPALGLVAYNNYSGKKGFNYWDGTKWSELVDSKNVSSLLGITQAYRVSNTVNVDLTTIQGALNYAENSLPGTVWSEVPGLTKNITITQTDNTVFVINEGMVQSNNSNVDSTKTFTYAIGVFLDGKLVSVRNYSAKYARSNQYDFFSINSLFKNLAVGNHTVKTYITLRANDYNSATLWRFGGALTSTTNDEMTKMHMFLKVTEKS